MLAVTKTGGHLGWFERAEGGGGGVRRWYVQPVVQFLTALVEVSHLLSLSRVGPCAELEPSLTVFINGREWQYGLPARKKPGVVRLGAGLVRQEGREDVGYKELSPGDESELVASGTTDSESESESGSKLFAGW